MNYFSPKRYPYIIAILTLLALNLGLTMTLFIKGPRPPLPPPDFIIKELGLEEDKREPLKRYMRTQRERDMSIQRNMRAKRLQLLDALSENPVDSNNLTDLINQLTHLQSQRDSFFITHYNDLKSLCTPEQQAQLKQLFIKGMKGPPRNGKRKGPKDRRE